MTNRSNVKHRKTQRRQTLPERCEYCTKGCEGKRDLERHYRVHHSDRALEAGLLSGKALERAACGYCDQTFARPDYLLRHLQNKHGVMRR